MRVKRRVASVVVLLFLWLQVGPWNAALLSAEVEEVPIYDENRVLSYVKTAWRVYADANHILRAMEEPDSFSSNITLGMKISGLLTALDILEKMQKEDYFGAIESGASWAIPAGASLAGYPWLTASGNFGYTVYQFGNWWQEKVDRIGINGQFEYYFYYRDEFKCSHHDVVSGNCWTLFLREGWLSKPTGAQSGTPSWKGSLKPEEFYELAENLYEARELASNRQLEETELKRELIAALQIEEGLAPSSPTDCGPACAEEEGLTGDEVAAILGNTADRARRDAIRSLEPPIKSGLIGADIAKILGESTETWRANMIQVIWEHARSGLDADEVVAILGNTSDRARRDAIRSLEPRIKLGLIGADIAKILGESTETWRANMIQVIWEHARSGLDAEEVVAILGSTSDRARRDAIRSLEPRVKYGLNGSEFSLILSDAEGVWRTSMIQVLSEHAKPGLEAPEAISPPDNGSSNNVEAGSDALETNGNAANKDSYTSLLPIRALSQRDVSNYRNTNSATRKDTLSGKSYTVSELACLATVYAMIEIAFGDQNAKIDDFYDDPGDDNNSKGAFIPPMASLMPLSGTSLDASFSQVGSSRPYDKELMITALDGGQLGILEGKRAGRFPHFILVKGYTRQEGVVMELIINDPWKGTESFIRADSPALDSFTYGSMRLIKSEREWNL